MRQSLFAVVQALATLGDDGRSVEEYRDVLLARMGALARTHDLLFESQWRGAELRSLAGMLQPLAGGRTEAIDVDGAPVELNARQALSAGLVLHELAMNAAKYGALSRARPRYRCDGRSPYLAPRRSKRRDRLAGRRI